MSEHEGNGDKARERAIRQVTALLQTQGFTEQEMEARAAKAQELLAKYKLQMSELGTTDKTPIIRDNDFLTDRAPWIKSLMQAVAKLYFCGYFYESFPGDWVRAQGLDKKNIRLHGGKHHKTYIRHNFIGKQADIVVAKMMGEYLINAMAAICKGEEMLWPVRERTSFRMSFMNACTARVCFRIYERFRATQTASTGTNLPALMSLYEQAQRDSDRYVEEQLKLQIKTKKNLARLNHAGGARAGHAAGDRVGLDQQVGGRSSVGQKRLT